MTGKETKVCHPISVTSTYTLLGDTCIYMYIIDQDVIKQSMLTQSQSLTPIFVFFILAIKYSYDRSFCMLIMEE